MTNRGGKSTFEQGPPRHRLFSEITKGVDQTVAAHATAYRSEFGRYTISAVIFMEVVRGYQKKQAARQLESFLAALGTQEVISFDRAAAELAGVIGGELERTGRPIGVADTMIAAIDLTQGLELVTGNTAHFQPIQQLGYPYIFSIGGFRTFRLNDRFKAGRRASWQLCA